MGWVVKVGVVDVFFCVLSVAVAFSQHGTWSYVCLCFLVFCTQGRNASTKRGGKGKGKNNTSAEPRNPGADCASATAPGTPATATTNATAATAAAAATEATVAETTAAGAATVVATATVTEAKEEGDALASRSGEGAFAGKGRGTKRRKREGAGEGGKKRGNEAMIPRKVSCALGTVALLCFCHVDGSCQYERATRWTIPCVIYWHETNKIAPVFPQQAYLFSARTGRGVSCSNGWALLAFCPTLLWSAPTPLPLRASLAAFSFVSFDLRSEISSVRCCL